MKRNCVIVTAQSQTLLLSVHLTAEGSFANRFCHIGFLSIITLLSQITFPTLKCFDCEESANALIKFGFHFYNDINTA